jgi:DNA-binding CsgD family transcriptional regulator
VLRYLERAGIPRRHIGRPALTFAKDELVAYVAQGLTMTDIARMTGHKRDTVARALRLHGIARVRGRRFRES